MPALDIINKHRAEVGAPLMTPEEHARLFGPRKADEPPPVDQRTIDIRMGLIDPSMPMEPSASDQSPSPEPDMAEGKRSARRK